MSKFLKCLIIMIMLFFLIGAKPTSTASADIKAKYTIAIIHSYDLNHACTFPQHNGITNTLFAYNKDMFNVREFFLNAKTQNVKRADQERVAKYLLAELETRNFDYFFTTDDLAFELIGIPLLKKGKKVLASGINKSFLDYQKEYIIPTDNLIVCEELIKLKDICAIFDEMKFRPTKWYILYDDTETSFYMLQNYERELAGRGQIIPIKVNNLNTLEKRIQEIQKDPVGIIVITLQTQYDDDLNMFVSKERFMKNVRKNNKVHLETTGNSLYAKFGFAIASGPDFEDMGKVVANKLINSIITGTWKHEVLQPKTKIGMNKQRLEELGFSNFLNSQYSIKVY